jgi:hypothetical protein
MRLDRSLYDFLPLIVSPPSVREIEFLHHFTRRAMLGGGPDAAKKRLIYRANHAIIDIYRNVYPTFY